MSGLAIQQQRVARLHLVFVAAVPVLHAALLALFSEDEERLFDRESMLYYLIDEECEHVAE